MFLRKLIFISLLFIFTTTVIGYGVYKAMPVFLGPKIDLTTPRNDQPLEGTTAAVTGTVTRTKALYVNKIPTAFSETGFFSTRIPIYPGSNVLVIEAVDRFGRTKTTTLNIGTK